MNMLESRCFVVRFMLVFGNWLLVVGVVLVSSFSRVCGCGLVSCLVRVV